MSRNAPGLARSVALAAVFVAALSAPAAAQSTDLTPILDRLERIERDIRTLNRQVARGGGGASEPAVSGAAEGGANLGSFARLEVRLEALENDLRAATGQVEQIAYQVRQIDQRLDKLVGDIDFRLSRLEQQGVAPGAGAPGATPEGAAPNLAAAPSPPPVQAVRPGTDGAAEPGTLGTLRQSDLDAFAARTEGTPAAAAAETPPAAPPEPVGVLPAGSSREQYAHAFGLLRKANYDEAEVALVAFLERHPDDPLAANARYWLGETFYVRGNYARAAETFLLSYQDDKKGPKAADSLLKLGMSLANLEKPREACATFDELARAIPDAPPPIAAKATSERRRLDCP